MTVDHLDLTEALHDCMLALLLATLAWAGVVATLSRWAPTRRWAAALTPRVIRAAVFGTVTGTLAVAPVHAADGLDGLPYPDRPVTKHSATIAPASAPDGATHEVQPGDTLWMIAAASLGNDADASAIALACRAWHEANRDTIGPDPNLILPGQRLTPPDAAVRR